MTFKLCSSCEQRFKQRITVESTTFKNQRD
nr:MAG TPA: Monocytic leukemia zinc finger protein finger, acetyl transferase, DNA [Caudoviricetes sp.]